MRKSERGNAVIFILIGIALFAALAYTFMRSMQSGQGSLTAGQTKIVAQKIIRNSIQIKQATDKLLRRGCSENELNFVINGGATMNNPLAPVDGSCDVFNSTGAGATYDSFGDFVGGAIVSGTMHLDGTETGAADLVYSYFNVDDQLCREINRQLGISSPGNIPEDASIAIGPLFEGVFSDAGTAEGPLNDEDTRLKNVLNACIFFTADTYSSFVVTLIDR